MTDTQTQLRSHNHIFRRQNFDIFDNNSTTDTALTGPNKNMVLEEIMNMTDLLTRKNYLYGELGRTEIGINLAESGRQASSQRKVEFMWCRG